MIANATGTNGLTCLPKHGGARDNKFWSHIKYITYIGTSGPITNSALCENRTRDLLRSRRVFPPLRHIGRQNTQNTYGLHTYKQNQP
jgi:hypothetical protein